MHVHFFFACNTGIATASATFSFVFKFFAAAAVLTLRVPEVLCLGERMAIVNYHLCTRSR